MGGIVSFKDRSPIFSILFRFLLSLFSFFMKFSIGKLPFRTFSCDSSRGRFYFFSHVLVSSLKITRKFEFEYNLNIRINLIFNSLDAM